MSFRKDMYVAKIYDEGGIIDAALADSSEAAEEWVRRELINLCASVFGFSGTGNNIKKASLQKLANTYDVLMDQPEGMTNYKITKA